MTSDELPWQPLVHLSEAVLAARDIAGVNLASAAGLPGAQGVNFERCLAVLDAWADHVRCETERCAVQYERDPAAFENSLAYFRTLVLATVLQQDCGVRYDPKLIDRDDFFGNAENLFIHGIIEGKGGTCSSLPPLYVAVGRRLGYPLKLAQTNSHLFARWEDLATGERFNIECTSQGLNCHPDDYYRTWPLPSTLEEIERSGWLVSQTPQEELAGFLANRGHCWLDNRRFREATEAYAWAGSLAPRQGGYATCLLSTLSRWDSELRKLLPPRFPELTIHMRERRFKDLALDLEREIVRLEVIEDLLENPGYRHDWWEPQRQAPHLPLAQIPAHITVTDPAALRSLRSHLPGQFAR